VAKRYTTPVTFVPTCVSYSCRLKGFPIGSYNVPLHIPVRLPPPPDPSLTVTDHIAVAGFPQ